MFDNATFDAIHAAAMIATLPVDVAELIVTQYLALEPYAPSDPDAIARAAIALARGLDGFDD